MFTKTRAKALHAIGGTKRHVFNGKTREFKSVGVNQSINTSRISILDREFLSSVVNIFGVGRIVGTTTTTVGCFTLL
jgi:hypothetical protein